MKHNKRPPSQLITLASEVRDEIYGYKGGAENFQEAISKYPDKVEEYKLAEILFTPQSKSTEIDEIEEIKDSIKKIGFESSAIAYSISNTASKGGNIGWLKKTQLSKNILREVENLNIGQITEVLDSPAGKLILILQDKREVNEEISLEEELKKAILIERNKQLNQFSSIYFKKVEINTIINEK